MNFLDVASQALREVGPSAVLCGRSAAYLHGLDQVRPETIDLLVPWDRSRSRPEIPGVSVRRTRAEGRRPVLIEPLPHTDAIDTVLDLADRTDSDSCIHWLAEAARRGLVSMTELTDALSARNRHRHRSVIRDVAADIALGATSNLEVRYSRDVERAHNLPKSVRQFIVPTTGHRADFAYPEARLLIELDGIAYHSGEAAVRDAALDAAHASEGWRTVRYRWGPVVGVPCEIAYEVARLLRETGLLVTAEPCRREKEAA